MATGSRGLRLRSRERMLPACTEGGMQTWLVYGVAGLPVLLAVACLAYFCVIAPAQHDALHHHYSVAVRLIREGNHPALRRELAARPRIADVRDNCSGNTLLHIAAERGDVESAAALLAAGAGINRADWGGGTALDVAERERHTAMASYLRAHGGRRGRGSRAVPAVLHEDSSPSGQ